jgi:hypothetical protein
MSVSLTTSRTLVSYPDRVSTGSGSYLEVWERDNAHTIMTPPACGEKNQTNPRDTFKAVISPHIKSVFMISVVFLSMSTFSFTDPTHKVDNIGCPNQVRKYAQQLW